MKEFRSSWISIQETSSGLTSSGSLLSLTLPPFTQTCQVCVELFNVGMLALTLSGAGPDAGCAGYGVLRVAATAPLSLELTRPAFIPAFYQDLCFLWGQVPVAQHEGSSRSWKALSSTLLQRNPRGIEAN